MPLTTRDTRAAALHHGSPWRGLWPAPDGGLDQDDRQQAAFMARLPANQPVLPDVPPVLPPPPWTIPEAGGAGTVRVVRRRRRW